MGSCCIKATMEPSKKYADYNNNELEFKNRKACWSPRKKPFVVLGFFVFFGLLLFATINTGSKLIAISRAGNYEGIFRVLSHIPAAFLAPLFVLVYVKMFRQCQQLDASLKETLEFASEYSPQLTALKYEQARQSSWRIFFHLAVGFTAFVTIYWALPVLEVWRMYPHVDYYKIYLPMVDNDFGLDRRKYFWCILAVSYCSGLTIVAVVVLSFVALPIYCTLIVAHIDILTGSLTAIAKHGHRRKTHEGGESDESETDERADIGQERDRRRAFMQLTSEKWTVLGGLFSSVRELQPEEGASSDEVASMLGTTPANITFRNCIIHHQKILRLLLQLKHLAAPFLFLMALNTMVTAANGAVVLTTAGTTSLKVFMLIAFLGFLLYFTAAIWYICKLKDSCWSVSKAAFQLEMRWDIPRKDLFIIVSRSLKEETFSCYLTSSLSFKDLYRMLDMTWNYYTIADAMANRHSGSTIASDVSSLASLSLQDVSIAFG